MDWTNPPGAPADDVREAFRPLFRSSERLHAGTAGEIAAEILRRAGFGPPEYAEAPSCDHGCPRPAVRSIVVRIGAGREIRPGSTQTVRLCEPCFGLLTMQMAGVVDVAGNLRL